MPSRAKFSLERILKKGFR